MPRSPAQYSDAVGSQREIRHDIILDMPRFHDDVAVLETQQLHLQAMGAVTNCNRHLAQRQEKLSVRGRIEGISTTDSYLL